MPGTSPTAARDYRGKYMGPAWSRPVDTGLDAANVPHEEALAGRTVMKTVAPFAGSLSGDARRARGMGTRAGYVGVVVSLSLTKGQEGRMGEDVR